MTTMLLPVKPCYAAAIMNGSKQYEYRKHKARKYPGRILFYATMPVGKIIGEAEVTGILEDIPPAIWWQTRDKAGMSLPDYETYFKGCKTAVAYKLAHVTRFETPRSLADYGLSHAPQNFVYVEDDRPLTFSEGLKLAMDQVTEEYPNTMRLLAHD